MSRKERQQAEFDRLSGMRVKDWPPELRKLWGNRMLSTKNHMDESAAVVREWVEREVK